MFAAVLAERIIKGAAGKAAKVICLKGDLGAGKTTFTQGFLKAIGAKGRVTSPTFVLMKRFSLLGKAKKAGFTNAYHIDAYRFRAPRESDALGLKEIFKDSKAIVIIEWPERLKGLLPRVKTSLNFKHGKEENERVIIAP
jgi:tRNA threonylcarbamoyladenosine biosynthesis protein TsaE